MTLWKPLTIDNLVRAQCIFVSAGNDFQDVKEPEFLEEHMGESWLYTCAQEAVQKLDAGTSEYEFIFDVIGSGRCRLYLYSARTDSLTREKFPGAKYSLVVTHMNHISASPKDVEARFDRIKQALLNDGFLAEKY